jgi:hypothetical protein
MTISTAAECKKPATSAGFLLVRAPNWAHAVRGSKKILKNRARAAQIDMAD